MARITKEKNSGVGYLLRFSDSRIERKWLDHIRQSHYVSKYLSACLFFAAAFTTLELFLVNNLFESPECAEIRVVNVILYACLAIAGYFSEGYSLMTRYVVYSSIAVYIHVNSTLKCYNEPVGGIFHQFFWFFFAKNTHWLRFFSFAVLLNFKIVPIRIRSILFFITVISHFVLPIPLSDAIQTLFVYGLPIAAIAYWIEFAGRLEFHRNLLQEYDDEKTFFDVILQSKWAIRRYLPLRDRVENVAPVPGYPDRFLVVEYGSGWEDVSGYTADELRKMNEKIVVEDDVQVLKEIGRFILSWVSCRSISSEVIEEARRGSGDENDSNELLVHFRIKLKDGSMKWVSDVLRPHFDSSGDFQYVVEIMTDQEKYHQKRMMREIAGATTDARRRTFAMVSHELRTPLNGLFGSSVLIRNTKLTDEQKEILGMMDDSLAILNLFVSNALLLSQIDSGLPIQIEPFKTSIADILEEVGRLITPIASSLGIEFIIEFLSSTDARVGVYGTTCVSKCCTNTCGKDCFGCKATPAHCLGGSGSVRGNRVDIPSDFSVDKKLLRQVLLNLINFEIRNSHRGGEVMVTIEAYYRTENETKQLCLGFSICRMGPVSMFVDREARKNSMILDSFYAQGTDRISGLRTPSFDYGTFRHLTQQPFMPHSMIDLHACKTLVHSLGGVLWDSTDLEHRIRTSSVSSTESSPEFRDSTSFHFYIPIEPISATVRLEKPKFTVKSDSDFNRAVQLLVYHSKDPLYNVHSMPNASFHVLLIEESQQAILVHERMLSSAGFNVHTASTTVEIENAFLETAQHCGLTLKTRISNQATKPTERNLEDNPFVFVISDAFVSDGNFMSETVPSPRADQDAFFSSSFTSASSTSSLGVTNSRSGSPKQLVELYLHSLWSKNGVCAAPLVILSCKSEYKQSSVAFTRSNAGMSGGPTVSIVKPLLIDSLNAGLRQIQELIHTQSSMFEDIDHVLHGSSAKETLEPLVKPQASRASSMISGTVARIPSSRTSSTSSATTASAT